MSQSPRTLSATELEQFHRDGFLVVRGLLSHDEALTWREHYMALHALGPVEGYFSPKPLEEINGDMLRAYPRMLHPHRWDETSRRYLLDARFEAVLTALFGEEPVAAQSMFYFKPPGARGQALHQDDFYLKTSPGHCMAAWLSLDDTDSQNGGLFVVPGSHKLPILCPHAADLRKSFTIEELDVPQGMEVVPVNLETGDCLFFNGAVIHGSEPNVTQDRFRRSLILHFVPRSTAAMSQWFSPLVRFSGEEIHCADAETGGPCGTDELEALRRGLLAQGELARSGLEQGAIAMP
ncbi:MAG TPA: phytanoyl-CoA dioxygenase family protein [Abditibacteriaceae bacterium]